MSVHSTLLRSVARLNPDLPGGGAAGIIQLRRKLALTPTLSPKERETLSSTPGFSLISDSSQRGQ